MANMRVCGGVVLALGAAAGVWAVGSMLLRGTDANRRSAVAPVTAPPEVVVAAGAEGSTAAGRAGAEDPARTELTSVEGLPPSEVVAQGADGSRAAGVLVLAVVDAESGLPLRDAHLRCASETRFAAVDCPGAAEIPLSEGEWEGVLTARGHDPVRLAPFLIAGGQRNEVGTIAMPVGSGVIEGRVLSSVAALQVELWGEGRNRCPSCAPPAASEAAEMSGFEPLKRIEPSGATAITLSISPRLTSTGSSQGTTFAISSDSIVRHSGERCATCGYDDDHSQLTPDALSGSFRFPRLAAGTYFLRAVDQEGRSSELMKVVLAPREQRWVEVSLVLGAPVVFELRDEHGEPFEGTWQGRQGLRTDVLRYRFFADGLEIGTATIGLQVTQFGFTFAMNVLGRLAAQDGEGGPKAVDRERAAEDTLAPEPAPPETGGRSFAIAKLAAHIHRVEMLPCSPLTYTVTCGPFRSSERPLLPSLDQLHGELVTMARVPPATEGDEEPGRPLEQAPDPLSELLRRVQEGRTENTPQDGGDAGG